MTTATRSNGTKPTHTDHGIVTAVNDGGIELNGQWLNYSKYGEPLPAVQRGDAVIAAFKGGEEVGKGRWLTRLALAESDPFAEDRTTLSSRLATQDHNPPAPTPNLTRTWNNGQPSLPGTPEPSPKPDRDSTMLRMSALKSAVANAGSGCGAPDVLDMAEVYLHWLKS
jgi:hypothetical protein